MAHHLRLPDRQNSKRIVQIAFVAVLVSAAALTASDFFKESPNSTERLVQTSITSAILGQKRDLIIHRPQDADSAAKYPVVYVLDGSSQEDHIANKFDVLSDAGIVPKVIVVGIPNMTGENRSLQLVPPFLKTDVDDPDSPFGVGDLFLKFMKFELFPFMEEAFHASDNRLFVGNSRGALLVVYSLISDPDMFSARFCFSGPYWRQDTILVSTVSGFLRSRDTLRTFLYLTVGTDEGEKGFTRMKETIGDYAPVGMTWFAEFTRNATHQDNAQRSASLAITRWGQYESRR